MMAAKRYRGPITEAEREAQRALHAPLDGDVVAQLPCSECGERQPTALIEQPDGNDRRLCDNCDWQLKIKGDPK